MIRCGVCGSAMTIATGKGGRYRYYKCSSRSRRGSPCHNTNAPMPTVDRLVLSSLSDRVFTEERVQTMLRELKDGRVHSRQDQQTFLKQLGAELEKNRQATDRLYEAVEAGLLPKDATLTERAQKLQERRQEILTEMAGIQREAEMPEKMLSSRNVRAFCGALRKRLADPGSGFGKQYLRLLVKEVRVTGKEIRMRGSYEALGHAIAQKNLGTPEGVPRFVPAWRALEDSNLWPLDS